MAETGNEFSIRKVVLDTSRRTFVTQVHGRGFSHNTLPIRTTKMVTVPLEVVLLVVSTWTKIGIQMIKVMDLLHFGHKHVWVPPKPIVKPGRPSLFCPDNQEVRPHHMLVCLNL